MPPLKNVKIGTQFVCNMSPVAQNLMRGQFTVERWSNATAFDYAREVSSQGRIGTLMEIGSSAHYGDDLYVLYFSEIDATDCLYWDEILFDCTLIVPKYCKIWNEINK